MSTRPAARRGPRRGQPSTPRRIRVLILLTGALPVVALARAVQLQAVDHPAFAARALDQHRTTIVLHAARGEIVDRRGRRLAVSEEAVTIGAYPREISQRTRVAVAVANATGQDPGVLVDRLRNAKALHIDLVRQADPEAAQALKDKNIRGLTFTPEERRVYPSGIAAQVIGTVDIESTGLAGLEKEYDGVLRGRDGREEHVRDPQGDTISVVSSQPAHQGETLELTARSRHPGDRRGGAAQDAGDVQGEGRDGGHPRPVDRRRARDGLEPRAGRRRLPQGDGRRAAHPRDHRPVRAGLDLQGRDGGRGPGARSASAR